MRNCERDREDCVCFSVFNTARNVLGGFQWFLLHHEKVCVYVSWIPSASKRLKGRLRFPLADPPPAKGGIQTAHLLFVCVCVCVFSLEPLITKTQLINTWQQS